MSVLDKILEEIEERIKELKEADNMCRVNAERNRNFESMKYFQSLMFATERAESIIGDIIRSHMDEAKDINIHSNDDWIPVEERLPEESLDSVLGWDEYRERCVFVQFLNGRWVLGNDTEVVLITAWQPLPTRYVPAVISKQAQDLRDREEFFQDDGGVMLHP